MMIIRIDDITVTFSNGQDTLIALKEISLEMENELIVVVGPSGCGKSTLLRVVAGLISPTRGSIKFSKTPPKFGMVFQDYSLLPWLTVEGNIEVGLKVQGVEKQVRQKIIEELLEQVSLLQFNDYYPHQLSGGMQQRTAVARALAVSPDILLMDEPFGALDAITREDLQDLMDNLYTHRKISTIFVTHDVEEAVFLADRIFVLSGDSHSIIGKIVIPFKRPRSLDIKESMSYQELRHEIFTILREG